MTSIQTLTAKPVTESATATAATAQVAWTNAADEFSMVHRIIVSFSVAPTAVPVLTVDSGSTEILNQYLDSKGPHVLDVYPLQTERGEDLTVDVTTAGTGVVCRLTVIGE